MKKKKRGNLYRKLQALSIFPLLALGIVVALFSINTFVNSLHFIVEEELAAVADTVTLTYDTLYPGDYELVGTVAYDLVKGGQVLTGDYSILDAVKENTRMELTLFYQDTRILTTICDTSGERIIGSGAPDKIISEVLKEGKPHFYDSAMINGEKYFAYYRPLINSDGTIAGMMFVGKPLITVNKSIIAAVTPVLLIAIVVALIVGLFTSAYVGNIVISLQKIQNFLFKISAGNLSVEMDRKVLSRNDELSEIGYSAVNMQRSLKTLIEQDALTELNNRRYGDSQLRQIQAKARSFGRDFTVAIGDIDFFKRVNDTYGHDCGDVVLKKVAAILKNKMAGKGYAIRWGGEEFLLVFNSSNLTYEDCCAEVDEILNQIRETDIQYENHTIRVTMTFGIVKGTSRTNVQEILREADNKLYHGKTTGRNQIIS